MATLDVSFVLDCPEVVTTILLRRAASQTQPDGKAASNSIWIPLSAVVIPDGGTQLVQTAEGDEVSGDITVYSRSNLTAGDRNTAADLVQWDGVLYKVINAKPYRYGSGFTKALCKQYDNNPSYLSSDYREESNALDPE